MAGKRLQLENQPGQARFGTTRWSVVLRAGVTGPEDQRRQALGDLANTYWYPLYAFARRRGNAPHDAMDLTQGFFAHLLAGDGLETVSRDKGRFRSFLLASFTNYTANQRRANNAIRRGGAETVVSLNADELEARYAREPADYRTPETAYLRNWVQSLLQRVRNRLADDYRRAGKAEFFELLEPHLTRTHDPQLRADVGKKLKLSPAALKMSLHRMRRRYGELLREEVALTIDDPAEVEDEIRSLQTIMGSPD